MAGCRVGQMNRAHVDAERPFQVVHEIGKYVVHGTIDTIPPRAVGFERFGIGGRVIIGVKAADARFPGTFRSSSSPAV